MHISQAAVVAVLHTAQMETTVTDTATEGTEQMALLVMLLYLYTGLVAMAVTAAAVAAAAVYRHTGTMPMSQLLALSTKKAVMAVLAVLARTDIKAVSLFIIKGWYIWLITIPA